MRKVLTRTCRATLAPGGPCALETGPSNGGAVTRPTADNASSTLGSMERLAAAPCLSDTSLGVVPEWTAQCGHLVLGWSKAEACAS